MTLELPPLRRYKDNLEVLATVFVQQAGAAARRRVTGIAPAALALLRAYDFPGNVRELRNLVEHAVILSRAEEIQPADLPERGAPSRTRAPAAAAPAPKRHDAARAARELARRRTSGAT